MAFLLFLSFFLLCCLVTFFSQRAFVCLFLFVCLFTGTLQAQKKRVCASSLAFLFFLGS